MDRQQAGQVGNFYEAALTAAPRFLEEMRFCNAAGIPHSWFTGGVHEWTEDDQNKALALERDNQKRCPDCRHYPHEDPGNIVGDLTRCQWCARLDVAADRLAQYEGVKYGMKIGLFPKEA